MNKLELRVIDLGPNRVVQIVKGDKFFAARFPFTDADVCIYDRDIDYIKQGLAQYLDKLNAEGEYQVRVLDGRYYVDGKWWQSESEAQAECDRLNGKHVPRIEKRGDVYHVYYTSTLYPDPMDGFFALGEDALKALEQIAGKPFDIYEPKPRYKGTWKRVAPVQLKHSAFALHFQMKEEINAKIAVSMSGIEIYSYTVTEEV